MIQNHSLKISATTLAFRVTVRFPVIFTQILTKTAKLVDTTLRSSVSFELVSVTPVKIGPTIIVADVGFLTCVYHKITLNPNSRDTNP